jgi:hypothetical protein
MNRNPDRPCQRICGLSAGCGAFGMAPGVRRATGAVAAVFAPAVATYTGVLVSDTAVPAWPAAAGELPFVFAGGAAASGGAAAVALAPGEATGPAGRLLLGGAALVAVPGRTRPWAARCGGALTLAGAALERFAVFSAGVAPARDPHQTVGPQRSRLSARQPKGVIA